MIFWTIFIPVCALVCILYFHYFDAIFSGAKKKFRIAVQHSNKPTRDEYRNTFLNLIVFSFLGLLLDIAVMKGQTNIYTGVPKNAWEITYLITSFFFTMVIHDIYFYVSHRLLHLKYIFKHIHSLHHHSHSVNPWSAFSFHPIEGIVQIAIVPMLAFIFPVHAYILLLFVFLMLFISVYGHSGYELRINKWKGFYVFNTSLHHFQHHEHVHYNFGIYLNIWDRLFGSRYPEYDASFKQLKIRIQSQTEEATHPKPLK